MDGNWGKMDGKLDLLKTKQIHKSKPTKSQHTNKSQKKLGLFLAGNFRIRTKNNKTRLETQRGSYEIVINLALDIKMMQGRTLIGRSFMKGADPAKNTRNTRREMREIARGNTRGTLKLTRTSHTCARFSDT